MKIRNLPNWPTGKVACIQHESRVLAANPWDDPVNRGLFVYTPADYDPAIELPVFWDLAAYTNAGPGHVNWRNHGENLPQRLDRLIATEAMGPVIMVFPDCYTSLGGNQYINSPALGRYDDYLIEELIPLIESRYKVANRAVFGKSSGGYGALMQALLHPEIWAAIACHSGDMFFDLVYRPDFPTACKVLARNKNNISDFMAKFWNSKQPGGDDFHTMMLLCMAATYSPVERGDLAAGDLPFSLPFDLETCQLDPDIWNRWLQFDPVEMSDEKLLVLKRLQGIYLDVGNRDQYNIHFGNRIFHKRLKELGIEHHYEEFDGTHSGIDHRLDISLPWLYSKLVNANADN